MTLINKKKVKMTDVEDENILTSIFKESFPGLLLKAYEIRMIDPDFRYYCRRLTYCLKMKETWISVLFFVLIVSSILTIAIGIGG